MGPSRGLMDGNAIDGHAYRLSLPRGDSVHGSGKRKADQSKDEAIALPGDPYATTAKKYFCAFAQKRLKKQ